jgi:hypothetical protein
MEALDVPPHAGGWSASVFDGPEPGPFELDPSLDADPSLDPLLGPPVDPEVTRSGWAPPVSPEAAFAEGGGTVRSLWQ